MTSHGQKLIRETGHWKASLMEKLWIGLEMTARSPTVHADRPSPEFQKQQYQVQEFQVADFPLGS
jgi:hypothetical protein